MTATDKSVYEAWYTTQHTEVICGVLKLDKKVPVSGLNNINGI